MMRSLLILGIILSATPSKAITWNEFWEPFVHDKKEHKHHKNHHHTYKQKYVECFKTVYREEYVPGNRWSSGYVRTWEDKIPIPCR